MEIVAGLVVGVLLLIGLAFFAIGARNNPPLRQRLGPERRLWWEVGSSVTGRFSSKKAENDDKES